MKTVFNRINLAIGILVLITVSPVFGQEKPPQQFPGAEQRLSAPNVRTTISSVDKAGVRHIENLNMKKSRTCFANYITNMPGTPVKFKLTDEEYEAWKTLTLKILKMTPVPKFDDPEGTLIEINLLILPWERSKLGLKKSSIMVNYKPGKNKLLDQFYSMAHKLLKKHKPKGWKMPKPAPVPTIVEPTSKPAKPGSKPATGKTGEAKRESTQSGKKASGPKPAD